jgi:hypothetical protein
MLLLLAVHSNCVFLPKNNQPYAIAFVVMQQDNNRQNEEQNISAGTETFHHFSYGITCVRAVYKISRQRKQLVDSLPGRARRHGRALRPRRLGSCQSPPRQIGHVRRVRSHLSTSHPAWKKWPHAGTTRTRSSSPPAAAYSDRQMAQRSSAFPLFMAACAYVMSVAVPSARSMSWTAAQAPEAAVTMATISTATATSSAKAVSSGPIMPAEMCALGHENRLLLARGWFLLPLPAALNAASFVAK